MQKRISIPLFLIGFFIIGFAQAQVKIGDNPQTIDPSSILELESSNKVLVITRVDESQMASIVPNRGAMVYNTTADCIYYYDGTAWISMCEAGGGLITDPELNAESTIAITPTANGNTIEIAPNSINSEQIRDGGINGIDIQDGSIGQGKLQDNSVTQNKLAENSVGAFALDNDNINLSDFTNDQGFITSADIVSANAGNSITPDANGAAFFDASTLENNIAANTTAIAADLDQSITNELQTLSISGDQLTITNGNTITIPTSSGSDTKIIDGTNTTVSGTGVVGDEYRINVANEVDGSITNELITSAVLNAANELVITEPGNLTTVDLSPLAGGGDDDQTAAEVPFTATGNTTSTNVQDAIVEIQTEVDGLSAGGEANTASNAGIGGVGITLTKSGTDLPFKSINAGDAGIISVTDDAANNEIDIDIVPATALPTPADQMLITNSITNQVEWAEIPSGTTTPTLAEVLATAGGNSAGNLQITDLGDPTAAQDAATKKYVDDNNALPDTQIFVGDAAGVKQAVALSGDATIDNAGVLTIEEEAVDSDKIANATIKLEDLSDMGATADGQVMRWNNTAGNWEIASAASHSGQSKSLFFADENGDPVQAFHPENGNPSLVWDYDARTVGTTSYGALGIGLDGGTINNNVKVHIAEQVFNNLAFPLMIQNRTGGDNTGSAVGMLFAVETNNFGKGALVYDRQESWARGDFHFLQEQSGNTDLPTLADKAFTVKNNKDIVLYGGIDINGIGTGTAGEVLKSTGTGVEWGDGGGLSAVTVTAGTFTGDGTSGSALDIADDAIGSAELAVNAVITENILNEAVTTEKIANNTILAEDLSDMGATNDQVLKWNGTAWAPADDDTSSTPYTDGAGLTLATDTFSVNVDDATIAVSGADQLEVKDDGITTAKILDGQVQTDDIADNNVTIEKIKESTTDGQVLTTNGSDVVWADAQNIGNSNLTLTAERTLSLGGNNLLFSTSGGGKIGIGDLPAAPQVQLDVNGSIRTREGFEATGGTAGSPGYGFYTSGDTNTGMFRAAADQLAFSTGGFEALRIDASQNVGIGTATPVEKLHVAGNVQVDGTVSTTADISSGGDILLNGNTVVPDYVFQKYFLGSSDLKEDYHFNNLKEIEAFIKKNHHLPGVTSAAKAQEEGHWNLSESNLQNLEKIEELFLYTIEQEKEIHKLKTEKEAMAQELKSIKNDLEEIKALLKK
ncbi:beta strand repeat-containing protein [Zobellia sp. OII3]|uniref:beta strand repeat-containing protein n=1 Tax=Zobellia sp. OII3 TaxID=2034520 RepID=UPI000F50D112|nr:TMF family protein [Zobellia sp. OII3]